MVEETIPPIEEINMEWDDWFAKYQPLMIDATMDDGDIMEFDKGQDAYEYIKKYMTSIPEDQICKHVWTTTSGDGWGYTSTGFHVVDRECLMVCRVPWVEENEACMYYDNGTWCDHCDDYVHSCKHDDDDWQDKADLLAEKDNL